MPLPKNTTFTHKVLSLLSVIRGYNILVLITAQYLASIFIFSPENKVFTVLFDLHLFFIVLSTLSVVAAGYIINNFYDSKADLINRPIKASLDRIVSQKTKLNLYFTLNTFGFLISFLVSWKAALFFALYIFGIWFYSHKLKKYPLTGLLAATLLTILPFFAVFVYYKNFSKIIFVHATFLFLVIMVRELVKDLENMRGAVVNNYQTFPVAYGEKTTKLLSASLLILTILPTIILFSYPEISYMKYYFYFTFVSLIVLGIILMKSNKTEHYVIIHTALKILLLLGVLSLTLIDTDLIIERVIDQLK